MALKVLPEGGEEEFNELENEVRLMRQMRHENIVQLHGAWKSKGWMIAMDLARCDAVRLYFKKQLPEPVLARIFADAVSGLAYMHELNILHRCVASLYTIFISMVKYIGVVSLCFGFDHI